MRTGAGNINDTVNGGYAAQGVTTIRWGTEALMGAYVVTKFTAKQLGESIKLPQGAGLTSTRVQLLDGTEWSIGVRDDTAMTPPKFGSVIVILDAGCNVPGNSNPLATYSARITDAQWEVTPKNAAERTITAEKLTLVD